jgi:hypothetical protein
VDEEKEDFGFADFIISERKSWVEKVLRVTK